MNGWDFCATVTNFKTEPRYLGPFEVVRQTARGNYILQELDGTEHTEQYAAFHIIPYVTHIDPQFTQLLQPSDDESYQDQDEDVDNGSDISDMDDLNEDHQENDENVEFTEM